MRALSPRTEENYRKVLARAYPTLRGKVVSSFGDFARLLPQSAPRELAKWPETSRRILRWAIARAYEEAGDEERGRALVRLITPAYQVKKKAVLPSLEEVSKFEACTKKRPDAERVVLLLTLKLGLRSEGVLSLRREDVEAAIESGELLYVSKGAAGEAHEKILPSEHVTELLQESLALPPVGLRGRIDADAEARRAKQGSMRWEKLGEVLSAGGYRTQHMKFYRAVRACAVCAKLDPKKFSPHKLRHAFASRLSRRGASMQVLKEALGHASINATQRYVHVEREELKGFLK